jgi:TPR repeat protein/DNA-directed RNA polymerase subunit RPC12/RpoP
MALIKCPECGNEVSTNAAACPVCGNRKLKKKTHFLFKVIIAIFILTVIGKLFGDENTDSPKQSEDAETQYQRGYKYGEKRDYSSAIRWYQKAAEQGYAPAEYELGKIYLSEDGFKDIKKGLELERKAADKNYAPAQFDIGLKYWLGSHGITQDYNKAIEWYQKADDNGEILASQTLASIYYKGENVPKDYKKAFQLYQKAAEFWPPAQKALGTMYDKGEGVSQDYGKAIEWYQKALDNGLEIFNLEDAKHLEKRLEQLKRK